MRCKLFFSCCYKYNFFTVFSVSRSRALYVAVDCCVCVYRVAGVPDKYCAEIERKLNNGPIHVRT